jgi:hypothetical protein
MRNAGMICGYAEVSAGGQTVGRRKALTVAGAAGVRVRNRPKADLRSLDGDDGPCPEGDLPADGFGRLGWVPPAGAKRRLGLTPTRKRRLFTAHAECRRWPGVTTDLT